MTVKNQKGKVYYGMHMYPGVAEYQDPGKDPYRVFLNEDTIRAMDPTFAGRPVFVMHVDGVEESLDKLRSEADGWVVESFYNQADGKHWVKFIVVSEKGEKAITRGMRLSNCYIPKGFRDGGLWNGVAYQKEVAGGEYEHLAIVPDPRYEESVILTPDQFKNYNEEKQLELKRLANQRETGAMKIQLFKRTKVENSMDLEGMSVLLPKSGKEMTIAEIVNSMDEYEIKKKEPQMANGDHSVAVGDAKMTVNELVAKHMAMCDELAAMKKPNDDGDGDSDDDMQNEEDKDEKKDEEKKENEEDKKDDDKKDEKKTNSNVADLEAAKKAKEKADRLRNAQANATQDVAKVDLIQDKIARGKKRYGSN